MIRRLVRSPGLSLSVFVLWLLLNGAVSVAHVLLGGLLALTLPWFADRLRDRPAHMRRLTLALRLGAVFAWDIVLSNIEVARRILGPESRIHPGFVWIPLELTNEYGIATLAGMITMTPGTLSADLDDDRKHLLVHCFHIENAAQVVADIKRRYEAPLKEIFP